MICPICGAEFESARSTQKYCSKKCDDASYYAKHREQILLTKKRRSILGRQRP